MLQAVGRHADTELLGLDKVGVKMQDRKIVVDKELRTSVDNIYALGDVVKGAPELTPVAIKEGHYLVDRLYANGQEYVDYDLVPTTIFTPLEYSVMGLSEEKARQKYGAENIEVYHTAFKPIEWSYLSTR